ncbi:hypothetical protein C0992_012228, partial [Termitomyces sp. T32_za158]
SGAGYAYALAALGKRGSAKHGEAYADEEGWARWEPYMQDHGLVDLGLGSPTETSPAKTKGEEAHHEHEHEREMGVRSREDEAWGEADDTLVAGVPFARVRVHTHERAPSTDVPLLRPRASSMSVSASGSDVDEFGVAGERTSMAGVGTARWSAAGGERRSGGSG